MFQDIFYKANIQIIPVLLLIMFILVIVGIVINFSRIKKLLPKNKTLILLLILIILLGISLRIGIGPWKNMMYFDEWDYHAAGLAIKSEGQFFLCNSGSIEDCENKAFPPHTPGFSFFLAIANFFHQDISTGFFVNFLFSTLLIPLVFLTTKLISKDNTLSLGAALLMSVEPLSIFVSSTANNEATSVFFLVLAIYSFYLFKEHKDDKSAMFFICSVLFAVSMKLEFIMLLALFLFAAPELLVRTKEGWNTIKHSLKQRQSMMPVIYKVLFILFSVVFLVSHMHFIIETKRYDRGEKTFVLGNALQNAIFYNGAIPRVCIIMLGLLAVSAIIVLVLALTKKTAYHACPVIWVSVISLLLCGLYLMYKFNHERFFSVLSPLIILGLCINLKSIVIANNPGPNHSEEKNSKDDTLNKKDYSINKKKETAAFSLNKELGTFSLNKGLSMIFVILAIALLIQGIPFVKKYNFSHTAESDINLLSSLSTTSSSLQLEKNALLVTYTPFLVNSITGMRATQLSPEIYSKITPMLDKGYPIYFFPGEFCRYPDTKQECDSFRNKYFLEEVAKGKTVGPYTAVLYKVTNIPINYSGQRT